MAVWSETSIANISTSKRIDSEYFHPEYISAEAIVLRNKTKTLKMLGRFLIGPFGSAFHVTNYDLNSPFRYIRGKDVKPFQLLDDDSVYMPPKDYERLSKYAVKTNDLLISVVGTLGNVAVVPDDLRGIFSCKSTIFRDSSVDPYFLLAYFNSKYGRNCLLRRQRGAIQAGLNRDDLEQVPVPIFNSRLQTEIGLLVRTALEKNKLSKTLYTQAQELLEKELGLNQLVLEKPKNYETSFSEVINGGRIDGEFHNPLLRAYYTILSSKYSLKPISAISTILKFSNPDYSTTGLPIITQKHLCTISPDGFEDDLLGSSEWCRKNNAAILQPNDLLFYSVGAYLGKTNIWLQEVQAVPASFITLLRANSEEDAGYLQILLNSPYGILQSKVYQSGTSQQYIYPKDIRKFLIPEVNKELKVSLLGFVKKSYQLKKESEQLLVQAKQEVENLIEGAVQ